MSYSKNQYSGFALIANMKRNQFFLLFIFLGFILLWPIDWQQSTSAAEGLLPRISFEKTVCDLGDVGQGTKNSCEFKFTNTGRGLLKIGKISRTCGCTVFQLDKHKTKLRTTTYFPTPKNTIPINIRNSGIISYLSGD